MPTLPRLKQGKHAPRGVLKLKSIVSIDPIYFMWLTALFLLALLTACLAWRMTYKNNLPLPSEKKTPDQWVQEASYLSIAPSQHLSIYLHASKVEQYHNPVITLFIQAHFIFYQHQTKTTWDLTAQKGSSPHLSKIVHFKGAIVLKKMMKAKEHLTLQTEEMTFYPRKKILIAETPGSIHYPNGKANFTKCVIDLEKNTVKLDNAMDITYQAIEK